MSTLPALRPICRPMTRSIFDAGKKSAERIISDLFSAGQQGFWLPFTNFASLTQDSAGTLPYTALEQPVGRVLDRSGRGNHASQVTSTARGVVSARVNALLNTDNPAAWGYAGSRFSVGAKEADDGWPLTALINSAAVLAAVNTDYPIGAGGVADATIVRSIELQAGTASFVRFGAASAYDAVTIDLVSKVIVYNLGAVPVTITTLADNWIRVEFWASRVGSLNATLLSNYLSWGLSQSGGVIGAAGQIGSTIKVRKPSYSRQALGYTAPVPFQRVGATATDYDAVGFPKYARLDGMDDFYTCGGGGSTTGFYYSDVVRPTSSASTVLFSDIGTNSGYELAIMNTGVWKLFFGNGTGFSSVEIGGVLISALTHVAVWDDASNIYLQINGGTPVTVARGVFVAGTANCALYRTNGSPAFFFRSQATEPIYRAGPPPSAYERSVIRGYQMQKAGL